MRDDEQKAFQETIQMTIDSFAEALGKRDFIGCIKKVGVLEYFGCPDVEFYTGLAYHCSEDFSNAITHLERVEERSQFYSDALMNLSLDYSFTGQYEKLCNVLNNSRYTGDALEKIERQIVCLEHISALDFPSLKETIERNASASVLGDLTNYEAEAFFRICKAFSVALVIAGECINQCLNYQMNNGKALTEFQPNSDIHRFISEYEKWCTILSFSSCIPRIKFANSNITSLADCALHSQSWTEKLRIFKDTDYVKQIIQVILTLVRPEMHPSIAPYDCVEPFLEAISHIRPEAIPQTVSFYFNTISEAYALGNNTAAQYIGHAYAEIIATDQDQFGLKDKIDTIRKKDDGYDPKKIAETIKLTRSMSRKGHNALLNALSSFSKTSDDAHGAHDYSSLSLQFFRVLEIEYTEKLLLPLGEKVDIQRLTEYAELDDAQREKKKWAYDCKYLEKIKNGERTSLELGKTRTLLAHIIGYWSKDDQSAQYLYGLIEQLLTAEGIQALQNKTMLDVIANASLERYRIPGAHTGYLPFSVANESKEYVMRWLPQVESWFE